MILLAVITICAVIFSVSGTEIRLYGRNILAEILTDCQQEKEGTVAFSASIIETQSFAVNQVVTFPNVFINFGNAYDNNTGVFTASKPGVYVFYVHGLSTPESGFWLRIFHNDTPTVTASESKDTAYRSGGNTVILKLKSRDRVYVKAVMPSAVYGYSYSTFSGYLISL